VVNEHAAPLLSTGVVSAILLGVKYSSSSLDKSLGSNEDSPDAEAVSEAKILLLCRLSG
jgi:hypothetical protein